MRKIKIYDLKILKKLILVLAGAVIGGVLLIILLPYQKLNYSDEQLEKLAKCLSEKNVIMYGNYNCPHCQSQKVAFKEAFKFIRYIECTENINLCLEAKIEAVPTWILSDGRKLVGFQGIEKLSKESGCMIK